jgi:F0F1-type ATP synthase membrane subunit b/b'
MSELKLKPELIPMVVQGGFYLAALVSAQILLVKPLLALTTERRRRTQGAEESAKGLELKLDRLEKSYNEAHKSAVTEARDLLNNQILAGQAEASGILQEAHETAKSKLVEVKEKIASQISQERAKIPAIVTELSDAALSGLVKNMLVVGFASLGVSAVASAGATAVDPYYGILWPYFQFIVFAAALTFLARKAISKMLDDRRDALRTKLSEAREAMTIAQRKSDEYEAKLKNLQTEIDAIRKEYADDGVRQRDKLIHEAKQAADQLLRDAERVGQQLISEGKEQLRQEIFDQVVATLDSKLNGDVLNKVDSSLRQNAIKGLQNAARASESH